MLLTETGAMEKEIAPGRSGFGPPTGVGRKPVKTLKGGTTRVDLT
jgi:hypothetical protein